MENKQMTKIVFENGSSITIIPTDSETVRSTIKQWDIDIEKFITETLNEKNVGKHTKNAGKM